MDKNVDQCSAVEYTAAQPTWSNPSKKKKNPCMFFSVSVLLLASAERFGVFRMRDFFLQRGGARRWRVCYQRGLPRLVLIGEEKNLWYIKNPAYRRHRISRLMLVEAPIQKKITWILIFIWGILLSRVGLLCTLQQSTGLHFYPLNYTALLFYAVHFIDKF